MRTIVFDLDGTLADTSGDLIAAANRCFELLGHRGVLDADADRLTAFHGGRAMLRLGFSRLGMVAPDTAVEDAFPRFIDAYAEDIDRLTRLYPGAEHAILRLREAGYATAICTNKPEALAERLLARLGIRELFGALVGADTLPVRKPDAAPYRAAVAWAGGTVGASAMIGDTETDVATARAAGVPVALVSFGPEGRGVGRLEPDALLDHFDALPQLAETLLGRA